MLGIKEIINMYRCVYYYVGVFNFIFWGVNFNDWLYGIMFVILYLLGNLNIFCNLKFCFD